jgi:insulin receptor
LLHVCCHFLIEPDQPEDLRASANSSSELVIEWKPPINPNGIVTHYIVTGSWRKDDQDYFDKLDACAERETFHIIKKKYLFLMKLIAIF